MKKLFLIMFFFMTTFSFSQSNDNFTYLCTVSDNKESEYYFYIEKVNYNSKEVWIKKIEPEKTVKNKKGKYIKTGGKEILQFMSINCSEYEFDVKQTISYDRNGNVIKNDTSQNYGNKVVPGSVMAGIFEGVCSE
ncbi:hypothetical protein FNW11_02950 [Flavobacterium gawalongense]|uniref:Surface-adhesin protein E-like domain-containing protein n=2 Tax=Flavobacterium gawalongense TaxID=2594432 RepID=A0A553BW56_9FLAO|nr:hypothetical protein FNW11_02950 [Flavobacterium gawalongense]